MSVSLKKLALSCVGLTAIAALSGCGGGSGGGTTPTPPPVGDTTNPTVSFSPATLSVESGQTGASTLTASDNVSVTSGPTVTCTNGGTFSGSTFTAPSTASEITSVCTATAGDAAGNQGSGTLTVTVTPTSAPPPLPPVGFIANINGQPADGDNLRFNEGDTVTLSIDPNQRLTSATLAQTTGPEINFGRFTVGGASAGNNLSLGAGFTLTLTDQEGERTATFPEGTLLIDVPLPAVNVDTPVSLAFSFTDGTLTRDTTISFTIADSAAASVVTVSGVVSIGKVSNARVIVTDATGELDDRLADAIVLAEDTTDENGRYTITLDAADIPGNLLGISAFMEGATMVCVSATPCVIDVGFGDSFTIIDGEGLVDFDGPGPGAPELEDAALGAVINTPTGGTALDGNLNAFTQLSFIRMAALAAQNGSVSATGNTILRPEDILPAQQFVANAFGLDNQDFTQLDFIDITQPITSTDQQAIRAALVSGGYMQATVIYGQLNILDFAETFISSQFPFFGFLAARYDGAIGFPGIALEDIFNSAASSATASANAGSSGADFDAAVQFIQARQAAIASAPTNTSVNADGTLPSNGNQ